MLMSHGWRRSAQAKICDIAVLPYMSSDTFAGSRVGSRIAALIDWWPCPLSRYVDPEGFLKADDRSDKVPCSVPPPCFHPNAPSR